MLNNICIVIIITFCLNSSCYALLFFNTKWGGSGTGNTEFNKPTDLIVDIVGIGARPSGIGEAFTAVSDDINAIQYNPAGIANLKRQEISLMHIEWIQELRYEVITYGLPIEDFGTIGTYILYFWTEKIEKLDDKGNILGEFFRVTGIDVVLSYATQPFRKIPLRTGVNLEIINESLGDVSSSGFAFDWITV